MCFGCHGDLVLQQAFAEWEQYRLEAKELSENVDRLLRDADEARRVGQLARARELEAEAKVLRTECGDAMDAMREAAAVLRAAGVNPRAETAGQDG